MKRVNVDEKRVDLEDAETREQDKIKLSERIRKGERGLIHTFRRSRSECDVRVPSNDRHTDSLSVDRSPIIRSN